ncbi:hypothetical protein AQUCO_00700929v1 [Aquilegia coerulea]|uniref:Uncharacterized protein n=1 Tax=Aquilegia coerulea TaxID=218851 RepID=A0A2G5EMA1_AQUCA|nr:hypothetical protein AQUCO_00700929v1 [Aquilegia coerulea]
MRPNEILSLALLVSLYMTYYLEKKIYTCAETRNNFFENFASRFTGFLEPQFINMIIYIALPEWSILVQLNFFFFLSNKRRKYTGVTT